MATYLVGDIHGCYDALQRLLEKVNFDPQQDLLWSVGDVVNRGGQSLEVLRLLHSFGSACTVTLGNHDLHLINNDYRHPEGRCKNREFRAILNAHDRQDLMSWLIAQPLAMWSKEHQLLLVHAGVVPQWSRKDTLRHAEEVSKVLRSEQRGKFLKRMYGNSPKRWKDNRKGWSRLRLITNILTRLRFCDERGSATFSLTGAPGSQPAGLLPWHQHKHRKTRKVRVAYGHWAAQGLRLKKRSMALDSGCVWGGKLSAVRLEDQRLIQVKGHEK